jgi:hypothetical protein
MYPGGDADRWQRVRQHLMHQWPALIRSLPARVEIVMQGGAVGLSDATVVVRSDSLAQSSRAQLTQAALHLAAHAALGHRPWRQHAAVADEALDGAAQRLLASLGIAPSEVAWCADHHGTWPGVPVSAPGETWAVRPVGKPSTEPDPAASRAAMPLETALDAVPDESKPVTSEEGDVRETTPRMAEAVGGLRTRQVTAAAINRNERPTDWRALLRLWLLQRSYQRWQFDRPARRRADPFILPRLAGRQLRLAVALDVSGSIDPQWFEQFFREIEAVRGLLPLQLRLLTCDNRIHLDRSIQGVVTVPPFEGGGGTDFRPVFHRLAGDAALDALIYCTDLMGDYPIHPPRFPVFWLVPAVVRAAPSHQPDPPFGQILSMRATGSMG